MPTANEAESVNMLNYFTGFNFRGTNNTYPSEECGGNFIDTADAYNNGESERLIGRWMENKRREDFVLATKFRAPTGKSPNDVGCSRFTTSILFFDQFFHNKIESTSWQQLRVL